MHVVCFLVFLRYYCVVIHHPADYESDWQLLRIVMYSSARMVGPHSLNSIKSMNLYPTTSTSTCVLPFSEALRFALFCFVVVFFSFIGSATLRSVALRYLSVSTATRNYSIMVANNQLTVFVIFISYY